MAASSETLNGDLALRALMRAGNMVWQPSPSGSVWRKRFHLVGGAESGQVTSIVRYEKDSSFPAHDHPDGEEILVLEGTFSDEHGDWPAGTYLLNPQGFRHAPFSREGCLLFVKLRQYAGADRHHVALRTDAMSWLSGSTPGIEIKTLYSEPGFADETRLERWPGVHPRGASAIRVGSKFWSSGERSETKVGFTASRRGCACPPGARTRRDHRKAVNSMSKRGR